MNDGALLEQYERCDAAFRKEIERLAWMLGVTTATVYRRWIAYADSCEDGDMSPTLPSFTDHIKSRLEFKNGPS